ncbi:uncharacterized protein ACIBXB_009047 [Morphnus guianensis]
MVQLPPGQAVAPEPRWPGGAGGREAREELFMFAGAKCSLGTAPATPGPNYSTRSPPPPPAHRRPWDRARPAPPGWPPCTPNLAGGCWPLPNTPGDQQRPGGCREPGQPHSRGSPWAEGAAAQRSPHGAPCRHRPRPVAAPQLGGPGHPKWGSWASWTGPAPKAPQASGAWTARPAHPQPGAAADLLPSTPGLPAAARPSRRHVLSREECAKSLPDVRGGQPATPSTAHRGGRRAPGTPHRPIAGLPAGPNPSPDRSCLATGPSPSLSRGVGVPRRGREVSLGQGCVPGVTVLPRPRSPRPARGPVSARWGRAGSCPAPPVPVPGRSAAKRKGAVRWNLGAGGDGAAGGGRARHVAAYVRKVQGRTGRRPGRWGHRHGDTEPPPRTCGRLRSRTRALGAARGAAGRCPALWARHVRAGARGRGHTCAGVGGTGPHRPLGLPVLPLRLLALAWGLGVPGRPRAGGDIREPRCSHRGAASPSPSGDERLRRELRHPRG